ncbi:MAG: hypothetical protein JWO42_2489 [Chloroflexi bacterium]|jgi:hypothetical protein|nr:hypothetical protein [Chloroflexota bacterium]
MNPFHVTTEIMPNSDPKVLPTTLVSIYIDEQFIGSYERDYSAYGASTFIPFEQNGQWYALYSADYTATRVMSLPDCRDLGGEEQSSLGFCPVEYYVPRYRIASRHNIETGATTEIYEFDNADRFERSTAVEDQGYKFGPWQYLRTALVAGCYWGDDSSWKVEVIDLSQAAVGVITRDHRFGYFMLPDNRALRDTFDFSDWHPDSPTVIVVRQEWLDLATGERVH